MLMYCLTILLIILFMQKKESIQYNACLAITGAIRSTSREKIYQELGIESLQLRRWYRKFCLFYKDFKNEHPNYLFNLFPVRGTPYATRTLGNIPLIKTKHNFFKKKFVHLLLLNEILRPQSYKLSEYFSL